MQYHPPHFDEYAATRAGTAQCSAIWVREYPAETETVMSFPFRIGGWGGPGSGPPPVLNQFPGFVPDAAGWPCHHLSGKAHLLGAQLAVPVGVGHGEGAVGHVLRHLGEELAELLAGQR